jgi:DNA (cytosine-5)-methyltransferase 1
MKRDLHSLTLDLGSELIVDNFAGGGGASTGLERAFGRPVDIAINHDPEALAMHAANHPRTTHYCESVFDVDPVEITGNQPVGLVWLSPDCKHFSKAKGGKPVSKKIRGLAWIALRWAATVKPRAMMLENVEEFVTWADVIEISSGKHIPDPDKKGETFRAFIGMLTTGVRRDHPALAEACEVLGYAIDGHEADRLSAGLGYTVDYRVLRACDYSVPTIRKRLFIVARRDGLPIIWPAQTHADPTSAAFKPGKLKPWRTAAECIDFSIPCPSIFERARPLADATLRRIARGLMKFVIESDDPFIVPAERLGVSTLIQTGYGEHEGQEPRVPGLDKPLGTAVAGGAKHALVAAFLAKHYGGVVGTGVDVPTGTITTTDHHSVVTATLEVAHEGNRSNSNRDTSGIDHTERKGRVLANRNIRPIRNDHAENAEAGGVQAEARVPGGEGVRGRPAVFDAGASGSLGVDQRTDPRWTGAEPRRRKQAQQLAGESRIGDARQESRARICDRAQETADQSDREQPGGASQSTAGAEHDVRGDREGNGRFPDDGISSGAARVVAFLIKFYSQGGQWQDARDPMHTIPTRDRIGLVTIHGEDYAIVDIGMRMLTPRELARAQGFPDSYVLDPIVNGKRLSKSAQVRMIGNSVCPDVATALIRANFAHEKELSTAAA